MKKLFRFIKFITILIISLLSVNSCNSREETASCFPNTPINVSLNLNLPAYYQLQNVGGWIYVNEQQSGTRGLIVVRTSGGFKAYDRNAPHICPENNTTLSVENDIKIVCPKDNSQWILLTGEPIAVASVQPKTYYTYYNSSSNVLNISN